MKAKLGPLARLTWLMSMSFGTGLSAQTGHGQHPAMPDTGAFRPKLGLMPIPVLAYSPETRVQFGGSVLVSIKLFRGVRVSNARVDLNVTQNKQRVFDFEYEMFLPEERFFVRAYYTRRFFPEYFWGIGNRAPNHAAERYEATRQEAEVLLLARPWRTKRLFVGPRVFLQNMGEVEPQPGGLMQATATLGQHGGLSSGLGFRAVTDTRNSILNPQKGFLGQVGAMAFARALGSGFRFHTVDWECRKYFTLGQQAHLTRHAGKWALHREPRTLALQVLGQHIIGAAPFRMLAMIGSSRDMRGYYAGRYRDNNYVSAQAEYRTPLFWRLGATLWLGVGDVFAHPSQLALAWVKPTIGFGGRFKIDRKENINLRADLGFGRDGAVGFYLGYGEAF